MAVDTMSSTRLDNAQSDQGTSLRSVPLSCGSRWFCAQTHPAAEFRAELDLMGKGFEAYLPLHLDRRSEHLEPLFSRYLFIRFDPARDQWRRIYRARGIASLVALTVDRPIPVPVGVIEDLQARTSARRIVDDPGQTPGAVYLRPGTALEVVQGPFAGFPARVVAMTRRDRLSALLSLFGRQVETEFHPRQVEAV